MKKVVEFFKNHQYLLYPLCVVIGGVLVYFFMPEKIKTEIKEVTQWKERVVTKEVVKWKDKIVEKVVQVTKKTFKKTVIIKLPDGTERTEIIEYSSEEELTKLEETLKEQYNAKLEEKDKEIIQLKEKTVTVTNPKRLKIYTGYNVRYPLEKEILFGAQYKVFGPVNVGIEATTKQNVYPVIGIEF